MCDDNRQKTAVVTGAAGFIGYHVSKCLLERGWRVVGVDSMSDYYDVSLKQKRENMLFKFEAYRSIHGKVETPNLLNQLFAEERPSVVLHFAAQAGVRYSIINPRAYLETNINGTFEILEAARAYPPEHMLLASTSSAYGANKEMPYVETQKTDHQISFYAATKKSTESIAHSYAHLYQLPITMLRFFTVYGPWGRPDMALFKFTNAILNGEDIEVYNHGNMKRDFTYIDDLISSVMSLLKLPPGALPEMEARIGNIDSKSDVGPFRIVNIGNSCPVPLYDFISAIEKSLGIKAKIKSMPMQSGDVEATWADVSLLQSLTNNLPNTVLQEGINNFCNWYMDFYNNDKI